MSSCAIVLCFTPGRGSACGCKPTPALKLATNSDMYRRMTGREIFDLMLRVASGERTEFEKLGYGDNEFVPWQVGAVM